MSHTPFDRFRVQLSFVFCLLSWFFCPIVALPHLRFMFSAINTKWEGDIGLYVALPLNDQPANDSKSEVEVRLIEFKEFVGFEVQKKRDVVYSI